MNDLEAIKSDLEVISSNYINAYRSWAVYSKAVKDFEVKDQQILCQKIANKDEKVKLEQRRLFMPDPIAYSYTHIKVMALEHCIACIARIFDTGPDCINIRAAKNNLSAMYDSEKPDEFMTLSQHIKKAQKSYEAANILEIRNHALSHSLRQPSDKANTSVGKVIKILDEIRPAITLFHSLLEEKVMSLELFQTDTLISAQAFWSTFENGLE